MDMMSVVNLLRAYYPVLVRDCDQDTDWSVFVRFPVFIVMFS